LFLQLLPEVIRLAKNEYANFVIQRILEVANHGLVDQMAEYVKLSVLDIATHKYACRVLQRVKLFFFYFFIFMILYTDFLVCKIKGSFLLKFVS
jgi:hypothetical protein